jgi:hypothetical protein
VCWGRGKRLGRGKKVQEMKLKHEWEEERKDEGGGEGREGGEALRVRLGWVSWARPAKRQGIFKHSKFCRSSGEASLICFKGFRFVK